MEMDGEQLNRGRDESCRILIGDSEVLLRTHRDLKRELCFSRVAIVSLVITCAGFCTLVFIQQAPGCKDEGRIRPNVTTQAMQTAYMGPRPADTRERPFAFLRFDNRGPSQSGLKNMTWLKNKRPHRFVLGDDKTSLIVPETGFYQISLQITYKQREQPKVQILKHLLRCYPTGYHDPIVLLSVFETVPAMEEWIRSVHSADVFILHEGDALRVEASHVEYVYKEERDAGTATFLAAHLVETMRYPETER